MDDPPRKELWVRASQRSECYCCDGQWSMGSFVRRRLICVQMWGVQYERVYSIDLRIIAKSLITGNPEVNFPIADDTRAALLPRCRSSRFAD